MKKRIAALAVGLVVVLTAAGLAARHAQTGRSCPPPVTKRMGIDTSAAENALEKWAAVDVAATFKHPASVGVALAAVYKYQPASADVVAAVGEGYENTMFGPLFTGKVRLYRVKLARDCAGGDWRVVSVKRIR